MLAWEHCRICPSSFLVECDKRRLNQAIFVVLYFSLFASLIAFSLCSLLKYCFCRLSKWQLDCVLWSMKLRLSSVCAVWQICLGSGDYIGTAASVPLVLESVLKHDELGYSYNNGPFMIMQR